MRIISNGTVCQMLQWIALGFIGALRCLLEGVSFQLTDGHWFLRRKEGGFSHFDRDEPSECLLEPQSERSSDPSVPGSNSTRPDCLAVNYSFVRIRLGVDALSPAPRIEATIR